MSEARDRYYAEIEEGWTQINRPIAHDYVSELEQQNKELINLLCERCDYIGVCEIEEIPCAVKKYKGEN